MLESPISSTTDSPAPDGSAGADVEILTWLDDCTRYALSVTACRQVDGDAVLATFRAAVATYGPPAATLTENGTVYTTRFVGGGCQEALKSLYDHDFVPQPVPQIRT